MADILAKEFYPILYRISKSWARDKISKKLSGTGLLHAMEAIIEWEKVPGNMRNADWWNEWHLKRETVLVLLLGRKKIHELLG